MPAIPYEQALQSYLALPGAQVNDETGVAAFNNYWGQIQELPEGAFEAMQKLFQAKPDQAVAFTQQAKGNVSQWFQSMVDWWTENGEKAGLMLDGYAPELELLDKLDYEIDPQALNTVTSQGGVGVLDPNNPGAQQLEPVLAGRLISDYINPALERDRLNSPRIDTIIGEADRSIDRAITANRAITGPSFDWNGYLRGNPDVAAWAQDQVAKGLAPDVATAAKRHFDAASAPAVFNPATYSAARPDLQNNWNAAQDPAADPNNPVVAYVRQFPSLEAYLESDFKSNPANLKPAIDPAMYQATRLQQENYQADETGRRIADAAGQAATAKLAALDQRKIEMESALNQMQGDRSGALDKQTAQLREGLALLETERLAAQQELARARVAAAETQVTGINQGLQAERDRITARTAQQGFIGGSSMEDAALARATIGARQGAAEAMGGAKVANAMDVRTVGDEVAKARFGITGTDATTRFGISEDTSRGRFNLADTLSGARVGVRGSLAEQEQAARDLATRARQGYFDADPARNLAASLTDASLSTNRLGLLTAGEDARYRGIDDAFKRLGWFTAQGTPPSTRPVNYDASQVGEGITQAGAGFARIGASLFNPSQIWSGAAPIRRDVPAQQVRPNPNTVGFVSDPNDYGEWDFGG